MSARLAATAAAQFMGKKLDTSAADPGAAATAARRSLRTNAGSASQ